MQGKHLTQKERFYIEKRRAEGVNQATIARELDLPRSTVSRGTQTQHRSYFQRFLFVQKGGHFGPGTAS